MLKKGSGADLNLYYLFLGFCIYGLSFILTIAALKYMNLTLVVAISSISYLVVLFLAVKYLGETFTWLKLSGMLVIMVGVVMMNWVIE